MRRPIGIALAVLVTVLLASVRIGDEPLWKDEVHSVRFASAPIGDLMDTVLTDEANMGPYYVALNGWLRFGDSPNWIRALSVFGGIASVAGMALLADRWFNRRVELIAPTLLALHPFFLDYLAEARAYSWAMAAVIVGSWAIGPQRIRPVIYGVAVGLACALNAVSALFVLAHAVGLGALRVPRRTWQRFGVGVAIAAVVFAPFSYVLLARREDQTPWISELDPVRVVAALKDLAGGDLLAVFTGLLLIVYAVRVVRGRTLEHGPTMALSCATVPIVGLIVVSTITPLFVDRFLIGMVPFFVLVAADLASQVRRRSLAAGAVAVVLVVGGWPIDEDRRRAGEPSEALDGINSTTRSPHA